MRLKTSQTAHFQQKFFKKNVKQLLSNLREFEKKK